MSRSKKFLFHCLVQIERSEYFYKIILQKNRQKEILYN
jgi:hypothetical protein